MSCSFVGGVDGIIRLGGDHRAGFCRRRSRRVVMREKDLGEKLFGLIFGKQEETPLGFQRFDRDRFPEQYEATLDEFADPVASDTEEMALFRPMLARTQLVTRELQLLYDAEEHGWTASAFHECVNKKGAGVVLAVTEGGTVCGGYNPKGWVGYGESRGSLASFLFTWPGGDTSKPAIKLRKVGGKSMSVLDDPETGPKFGADGLVVMLMSPFQTELDGSEKIASSKLGTFYEVRPDGVRHLFSKAEGKKTKLVSLRAYFGVYEEGEEIPFDDAVPVALE
uniref:TLDc domain-containing protein n=1 Tax=Rhodosorus marinus TaxID=101924 RepID=A0A7S2ZTI4_9RHOD